MSMSLCYLIGQHTRDQDQIQKDLCSLLSLFFFPFSFLSWFELRGRQQRPKRLGWSWEVVVKRKEISGKKNQIKVAACKSTTGHHQKRLRDLPPKANSTVQRVPARRQAHNRERGVVGDDGAIGLAYTHTKIRNLIISFSLISFLGIFFFSYMLSNFFRPLACPTDSFSSLFLPVFIHLLFFHCEIEHSPFVYTASHKKKVQ